MNAAQREARLVKHYIRALGLCAVWRATDDRGRREVGFTQDVPAAERRLAAQGFIAFEAWWSPSRADAESALPMIERGPVGPGLTSRAILMLYQTASARRPDALSRRRKRARTGSTV